MELRQYIKRKIIFFSIFLILGVVFFMSRRTEAAHQNAFICCLIDDMSFQYKTVVFYTGEEIEIERLSRFYSHNFFMDDTPDTRLGLYDYRALIEEETNEETGNYPAFETSINASTRGRISISYQAEEGSSKDIKSYIKEMGGSFYRVDEGDKYSLPLSFPADTSIDATSADINRAYEIASELGNGFTEALEFINNGENYSSADQLIDAGYALCTISDGGYITGPVGSNGKGPKFKVNFVTEQSEDGNGYQYNCKITEENFARDYKNHYSSSKYSDPSSEVIGNGSFVWKVKKGYKGADPEDILEDGSHNTLADTYSGVDDTTYISWEHLFVEAGTLYAQGITYANQADIYSMDALESSVVSFVRNLLSGLTGYIDTYSMEDLIFNSGVRGSGAFYFGTFSRNWTDYLLNMFLIFSAIAVSLVFFLVIRMIMKKNLSTANIYERISLMEEIKNLLLSLFFIAFAWGAVRVLMLLNYKFVNIWGAFADGRTLSTIHSSSVLFSGIIIQFVYFILEIYVNYVYIVRGLVIASLLITSPLFILAYNFGRKGKSVTMAFLRELTGSIFLQSFHAVVYGLVLICGASTRGVESLVIICSLIPLTSIYKEICGCGGNEILKACQGLTSMTANAGAAAVGTAASAIGSTVEGIGSTVGEAVGGPAGAIVGGGSKILGGSIEASGGLFQAGTGLGLNMSGVGGGNGSIMSGIRRVERGLGKEVDGATHIPGEMGSSQNINTSYAAESFDASKVGDPENDTGYKRLSYQMFDTSGGINGDTSFGKTPQNSFTYGDHSPEGGVIETAGLDKFMEPSFKGKVKTMGGLGSMDDVGIKREIEASRAFNSFSHKGAIIESGIDNKTGQTYLQQAYVSQGGLNTVDMGGRDMAIYDAIREREMASRDDRMNNTTKNVSAFNRKYGVSYSDIDYIRDSDTGITDKRLILGNYMGNTNG